MPRGSEADTPIPARRGQGHGAIDKRSTRAGEVERIEVDVDPGDAEADAMRQLRGKGVEMVVGHDVHAESVPADITDQASALLRTFVAS